MEQTWKVKLSGVFTALVTPFKDGKLDTHALERHVERQLDLGLHGLVPVSAIGEAETLTEAETAEVIRVAVERSRGRAFVLAGVGSNDTAETIANAQRAADQGVDGLFIETPHRNKPSRASLFDHFAAVASAVRLPIMLCSIPGRNDAEPAVETTARLAGDFANIVGIKVAGEEIRRVTELRQKCGSGFVIHCDDDNLALAFYAMGADGLTSVASNLIPYELLEMYSAWRQGDTERALKLHESAFKLIKTLSVENNPVPVKVALDFSGVLRAEVRRPLAPLSEASHATLLRCLKRHTEMVG